MHHTGSQDVNFEAAQEPALPEELPEGVEDVELPECPNHVGVDFEEGKPRSIIPILLTVNLLLLYVMMH